MMHSGGDGNGCDGCMVIDVIVMVVAMMTVIVLLIVVLGEVSPLCLWLWCICGL